MTYKYNLSGAMTEQKYPSGRIVKNVLDSDGMLSMIQSKKDAHSGYFNYAKSFRYNATGAVESMQLGNGKWESTTFNSRLQPTQIALGTVQNGTDKLKLNFEYNTAGQNDNNSNVLKQTITVPDTINATGFEAIQTYNYDELNRLKSAEEKIANVTSWKQTFTFDRYGNKRFDENNTDTLQDGCATAVCNPTIDPAINKLIGYTFDNSGNTKTDANGQTFTYDGENKQIKVVSGSTTVGEYFYDGDGKRIKKIAGSEETIFIYNASGQLVAEYSTQISQTPKVSYLTADHLGSPRIITDMDGDVYTRRDFMPFGEEIDSTHTSQRTATLNYASDEIKQKFTSYERDNETDLDFAQARMYANKLGRFTAVDPVLIEKKRLVDPQGINLFIYARNNPLKFIDPDGEKYKGTDDQEVIIEREKVNGKKIWVIKSGNASKDLQKLVGLINNSGSKTASKLFGKLNKHETMINIIIDTTTTGGGRYGLHEAHDKNGPVKFDSPNEKFVGPADPAKDDKDAYREATITLFQKEYEDDGATGAALDAQLVAVFGHEARHDLDPKQVQAGTSGKGSNAIWHPKRFDKKLKRNVDAKRFPDWYQEKILKQIEKTKGIKAGRY